MAPNIKDYGISSYSWNPPSWTPEKEKASNAENSRMLNETARRNGFSREWVRALGGIPDPDIR